MHIQGRDDKLMDFENHTMLTSLALSNAIKAQMPDVKDVIVSCNGGGGAKQFVKRLEGHFGKVFLSIPNNPALRRMTLMISGAGDDWKYNKDGKRMFYNLNDVPDC